VKNQTSDRKQPEQFNIVFSGRLSKDIHKENIRTWLTKNFKLTDSAASRFFFGRPFIVKRDIDLKTAEHYRKKLLEGGIVCNILPAENHSRSVSQMDSALPLSSSVSTDTIHCPKCGFEQIESKSLFKNCHIVVVWCFLSLDFNCCTVIFYHFLSNSNSQYTTLWYFLNRL